MKANPKLSLALFYGIFFLMFLQLLSDFVETIYAFGLLRTSLTGEIASVVLLFAPVALLFARKGCPKVALALLGCFVLVARLLEVWLGPGGKLIASGIGVGSWLVLFPAWLWYVARAVPPDDDQNASAAALGLGLTLGLSSSILLRTLGAGFDISTYGWTQVIGWAIVAVGGWGLWRIVRPGSPFPAVSPETPAALSRPRFGKVLGLSVGMVSALTFIYFALMSPNVIARWTGVAYPFVVFGLMAALGVWGWLLIAYPRRLLRLPPAVVLLWNAVFVLALALTLRAHQIAFPADASAYPLPEPAVAWWGRLALWALLLTCPVALLDFALCMRELLAIRPTLPQFGGSFALGALWLLLLILAQVFTTVYDYIPVVGPWFRDRFWLVFLAVGLGCALPVWLARQRRDAAAERPALGGASLTLIWAGLCALIIVAAWGLSPRPPAQPADARIVRVMTYNIQQGYNTDGVKDFAGQLAVLRAANADLIGLQETDTNRIAGGNADIVGYFARALRMYSAYGPSTVPGTFGIALLSRYPIEAVETFYMHSLGEQTATIAARVRVGERTFNVYVTHLGNGGPLVQQTAILDWVRGQSDVIMMGDFNFRPETEQYRLTTLEFADAWVAQTEAAIIEPGFNPERRIDHIFVTPGTQVARTRYLLSPHSDHPALWADVTWWEEP